MSRPTWFLHGYDPVRGEFILVGPLGEERVSVADVHNVAIGERETPAAALTRAKREAIAQYVKETPMHDPNDCPTPARLTLDDRPRMPFASEEQARQVAYKGTGARLGHGGGNYNAPATDAPERSPSLAERLDMLASATDERDRGMYQMIEALREQVGWLTNAVQVLQRGTGVPL